MRRFHRPLVLLPLAAVVLGAAPSAQQRAGAEERSGDYAGWAYLETGADLPLRWHWRVEGETPVITMSLPHQKTFDLAADSVVTSDGSVRVALRTQGPEFSFSGKMEDDAIRGTLRLVERSSSCAPPGP